VTKPPADFTSGAWVGTLEAAAYFRKSQRVIQRWCEDEFLDECKVPTYQDIAGRWWIKIGNEISDRAKGDKSASIVLHA
jgi:hypothetical protein